MSSITVEGNQFLFQNEKKQVVLLDVKDFMANKSRLPMHTLTGDLTIPGLLSDLKEKHKSIGEGTDESEFSALLLDILLTSYFIRSSAPLKVLEIGSVSGVLSYHLAALLGKLNRESRLCCVSNVIGNESANHWLDRISMVEQLPNLSMVAADYEDTQLRTDHFDIVILNGTTGFEKPYETIREAERLVKKGGILLCHAKDAPLLESNFKLIFSQREEYEILPQETILVTVYPGYSWGQEKQPDLAVEVSELYDTLQQTLETASCPEEIRPCVHRIDQCVDRAVSTYDIRRKVELIQLKELVLDYILNMESEFGALYRERIFDLLV